ncbi:MAG: hypothetical protein IJ361_05245 [Spirochaetaceae bacterium]|nr:hypothetical protein [Spirochaetaceae bacterium]
MSFKDNLNETISTVSKILIPILLVILGGILGLILIGFLGEAIWLGLAWCFGKIWKILLVGIIILFIFGFLANN